MVRLNPENEGGRPSSARMAIRVFHTKPTYSRKSPWMDGFKRKALAVTPGGGLVFAFQSLQEQVAIVRV
jgi:hypothetical protein